jgi:hypothetical protein
MDQVPYRLPLVIGATGHRDLRDEDTPALRRAVREVIERLRREYVCKRPWFCGVPGLRILCRWLRLCPESETPIIILSSLAEGADRLIAREAMDLGAKLIAPLPMEADEYRYDFSPERRIKPDALVEFDRLLATAVESRAMPYAKKNRDEADPRAAVHTDDDKRALQYREVGLFIVRHCHVLIALWNGTESEAVGGTAEVVRFKRDGIPLEVTQSARASLDAPEIGPVVHIETPRATTGADATAITVHPWGRTVVKRFRGGWVRRGWRNTVKFFASAAGVKFGDDRPRLAEVEKRELDSWQAFAAQTKLTRRFNRGAARLPRSRRGALQLTSSMNYLFFNSDKNAPEETVRDRATQLLPRWCGFYQTADAMAVTWRRRFEWDWWMLFVLGFVGILSFEIVTHLRPDWFPLYAFYGFVFICVLVWFIIADFREHQERFLDFRALAEALRVAVFWKLVGIGGPFGISLQGHPVVDLSSGDSVAAAYPIRQPSELNWVKTCLRTLELLDAGKSGSPEYKIEVEGYAWARAYWVHGQLGFFAKRGPEHDRLAEGRENRSIVLLFLSTLLAIIFFFVVGEGDASGHSSSLHRIFIFLIGLLPGAAAVTAGYSERLALKAQARQYDRMHTLFARAAQLLPEKVEAAEFGRMQALFAELGAEAMKENAEWVAIYRQRPIRPP